MLGSSEPIDLALKLNPNLIATDHQLFKADDFGKRRVRIDRRFLGIFVYDSVRHAFLVKTTIGNFTIYYVKNTDCILIETQLQ